MCIKLSKIKFEIKYTQNTINNIKDILHWTKRCAVSTECTAGKW